MYYYQLVLPPYRLIDNTKETVVCQCRASTAATLGITHMSMPVLRQQLTQY